MAVPLYIARLFHRLKGSCGGSWLPGMTPLLWLSATLVLAEGVALGPEVIRAVQEKYGAPAAQRVREWQRLMSDNQDRSEQEKLGMVNNFFNQLRFSSDIRLWGKTDYWATPIEAIGKGAGDCEDYSIAKYFTLRELGVPDSKMRIMYVKALRLDQAHMVLTYYPSPSAVPLVLDNINKRILPATRRTDLAPVYSFNGDGLWLAKSRDRGLRVGTSKRINLWQDLKARMQREKGDNEN